MSPCTVDRILVNAKYLEPCQVHNSIMVSKQHETDLFSSLTIQVPNINLRHEGLNPLSYANKISLSTPREYEIKYVDPVDGNEKIRTICSAWPHYTDYFTNLLFVSQNTIDQLCWNQISEQVSLTMEDYAYTQRVIDALAEMGYLAISPYQLGSVTVVEEKAL